MRTVQCNLYQITSNKIYVIGDTEFQLDERSNGPEKGQNSFEFVQTTRVAV